MGEACKYATKIEQKFKNKGKNKGNKSNKINQGIGMPCNSYKSSLHFNEESCIKKTFLANIQPSNSTKEKLVLGTENSPSKEKKEINLIDAKCKPCFYFSKNKSFTLRVGGNEDPLPLMNVGTGNAFTICNHVQLSGLMEAKRSRLLNVYSHTP